MELQGINQQQDSENQPVSAHLPTCTLYSALRFSIYGFLFHHLCKIIRKILFNLSQSKVLLRNV